MKKFNKYVPLTNHDIDNIMQELGIKGYRGCFMRDTIPKMKLGESIIINLDDSKGNGTHWVSAFMKNDKLCYMDSYGLNYPNELRIRNPTKKIEYNTSHIQEIETSSCGWFCIYFINEMYKGKEFYDIMFPFDLNHQSMNEKYIEKYFKKLGY